MNLYDYYAEPEKLVWYDRSRTNFFLLRKSVVSLESRIDKMYMLPVCVVIFEDEAFSKLLDSLLLISEIASDSRAPEDQRIISRFFVERWITAIQLRYNSMDMRPRKKARDFVAQLKQNMEEALK